MKEKSIFSLCITIAMLMGAILIFQPYFGFAQQSTTPHNGQHDFDFNFGKWRTHIQSLQHPLSGSTTWAKLEGTVVVRKVWDGRASLEEIEADGPAGHFEGTTLFLYNPKSHQWSQTFANSDAGSLEIPAIGEFKNGRGEFYSQEVYHGRAVLVRGIWSEIKTDTHRFEQAYSNDGGKTWETNFIANLERYK
ncbi:hypothetical protein [Mucilaginibacter sp. OK098]|uniref:hypothetical protein n=1 Tax=Mucilaginibacter sp. OK098 TaxID=1855297 RepID=UPI0009178FC5|nr:hypothetical protein [Mucilaginibacter sp. OK098]SHL87779.1 hypothetical protein SAMN05216524_10129 [Mucilaginibacter sp. OK098]